MGTFFCCKFYRFVVCLQGRLPECLTCYSSQMQRGFALHEINGSFYNWDENKHKENIKKHGVDFMKAATVINEPNAITEYDEEHSYNKARI